jgi:hypothetical protein
LSSCRERGVLCSRWGTPSPAGRPRNTREGNLRRMPGDRPMRRLRDPVRRTVRRLGWDVGAGTRRLSARTWPGAGGRTDSQRRPKQQGNRDPVTLPRPTCRWFCCRTMGRCSSDATSRAVRPAAVLADWSRRSSAPMSDLPDAVWVCAPPPTRTRCGWRARPPGVQRHPGARAAAPRPGRAHLSGAPGFHCSAAPGRGRPPGSWPAMSRTERCCGDSCTAWRWDRVAAVIDQQLRARSSSRKLADLAREMVQQAQRERVAALAIDDARGRVAEQALQAGPNRAGPTYRGPGPSPRGPGRTGASRRPERLSEGWPW